VGLYKRKDSPVWWYSFTRAGVRFRGSTETEDKAEALKIFERAKTEHGNSARVKKWKWREFAGAYWFEHGQHCQNKKTMQTQLEYLSDHIGPNSYVDNLTNAVFTRYIQKRRAVVSNSTVNRELQLARAVMMYCEDIHNQVIPCISWKRLKLKEPPRRERFLSADEFDRLMAIKDQEIADISAWAVYTGMRKDNIKTLVRPQIDMAAQRARLLTKGNKRQIIDLSSAAMALLAARSDRQGRIFDFTNFEKRWRAALIEAEISDLRFHDLRHTFASWARMSGVDILDLKEAMNHSDISTTMRYAHVSPNYVQSAHEKVAQSPFLSRNRSRSTRADLQAIDNKRKN